MPAADRSPSQRLDEIDHLTVMACEAAERGDWDVVEMYVRRRGLIIGHTPVPEELKARWFAIDIQIQHLAEHAKAAIEVALREAGHTRRSLDRLRESHVSLQCPPSRFTNVRA